MSASVVPLSRAIIPRSARMKLLALFLSAHLDESGTHQGSPYTVMGGYVSTERRWLLFEYEWRELLARFGVTAYHSTEFLARKKEFEDWNDAKVRNFVKEAEALLRRLTLFSTVTVLVNKDYDEYRKNLGIKRHVPPSPYGFCFQDCMTHVVQYVQKAWPSERVSFVLEGGHKNQTGALQIFNTSKYGKLNHAGDVGILAPNLGAIAFESGLASLEAADFLTNRSYQAALNRRFHPSKPRGRPIRDFRFLVNRSLLSALTRNLRAERERHRQYAAHQLKKSRGSL